jgi:hypothetical protein
VKHHVVTILALACTWLACGSSANSGGAGATPCTAGESRACACPNGEQSVQTCGASGTLGLCACAPDGSPAPQVRTCAPNSDGGVASPKKCQICDFDVDATKVPATCAVAPACGNGNLGTPVVTTVRDDLSIHTDNGNLVPSSATAPPPKDGKCLDPQLRIRVQKIKVIKGGGQAYCIIQANDGVTSEAALTMKTNDLKEGDEFPFPVGQATLWGQAVPECTSNNLTISYYCYHVVDNSAWSSALNAMGDTAAQIGGSPAGGGTYGWAFGLGGAAANAAAAAITAASKDDNRIRVEQTIPVSALLDLTNGRTWTVRTQVKDGCGLLGCDRDYDWELTLQAWGCADKLPEPR